MYGEGDEEDEVADLSVFVGGHKGIVINTTPKSHSRGIIPFHSLGCTQFLEVNQSLRSVQTADQDQSTHIFSRDRKPMSFPKMEYNLRLVLLAPP